MLSSVDLELIDQKQRTLISWDSNPWNAFLHYVTDSESTLIEEEQTLTKSIYTLMGFKPMKHCLALAGFHTVKVFSEKGCNLGQEHVNNMRFGKHGNKVFCTNNPVF